MSHLDEGTIHAWLDGALDARQAAEAQAHVNACPECAANVAEARGLIAASSRILTALDDVPGGVLPQRAPAPRAAKFRRWASSPWMTGVAAVFVLVALWRTTGIQGTGAKGAVRNFDIDLANLDSVALITIPSAPAPTISAPQAMPAPQPASPRPSRAGARAAVTGQVAEEAQSMTASAASALPRAVADSTALGARLSALAESRERQAESRDLEAKDARAAGSSWSGCYRLAVAVAKMNADAANTGAGAGGAGIGAVTEATRRARAAAPAPAAMQKSELAPSAAAPIVRLDTIPRQPGFAVRSTGTRADSTIGVWRELSSDSARVELASRGVFTLARRDRIACPE